MKFINLLFLSFLFLTNCTTTKKTTDFDYSKLAVEWELIRNGIDGKDICEAAFTIHNQSNQVFSQKDWTLYFSQLPKTFIPSSITGGIKIEQVQGDFYKLFPTEKFKDIAPDESRKITYQTNYWAIKKSDAPAGLYFIPKGKTPIEVKTYSIAPFEKPAQINRNKNDKYPIPTPAFRYEQNESVQQTASKKLIPTPVSLVEQKGTVNLNTSYKIYYQKELAHEATQLNAIVKTVLGKGFETNEGTTTGKNTISLQLSNQAILGKKKEAYRLQISQSGIRILATDRAGAFYAIQSLKALIPVEAFHKKQKDIILDAMEITDYPRFEYRGLHLDVSRNFHKKESVMKLLDLMAFYKLNKFHFHLTDDEGWRLEIDGLPELTSVGAQRGHTENELDKLRPAYGSGPFSDFPGTGFYSRKDFIEILRYATARHIEIIPAVDMPGHARAAIKAMEARYHNLKEKDEAAAKEFLLTDLNDQSKYKSVQDYTDNVISVCQESTYRFLEKVVDEIVAMYKTANAPLTTIHIGGDETPGGVWTKSPACNNLITNDASLNNPSDLWNYFLKRYSAIISKHGLTTGGWEEISMHMVETKDGKKHEPNPEFINSHFLTYFWNAIFGWGNEDVGYQLANAGYKVVMCNASNLYFDLAYDKDPQETGLYWAGFVDSKKPFEFMPFDLFKAAEMGRFGEKLSPEQVAKGKVKLTAEGRKNIVGIQGQIWSETIHSQKMLEYYAFPKLISLAERAWAQQAAWATIDNTQKRRKGMTAAWSSFATTLGEKEMPRMDIVGKGINYRIPPPGVKLENGMLLANTAFPGLIIRYTTDGSEPNPSSLIYSSPIKFSKNLKLKAFSKYNHSSRTVNSSQLTVDSSQ
ncbi:MAG TPA: beta-N-acetylhexosaminidase [Saprospiraceae bacterium]|nr:beta-N-acetylhexosaminidase [Saprospiraceae bacterium]